MLANKEQLHTEGEKGKPIKQQIAEAVVELFQTNSDQVGVYIGTNDYRSRISTACNAILDDGRSISIYSSLSQISETGQVEESYVIYSDNNPIYRLDLVRGDQAMEKFHQFQACDRIVIKTHLRPLPSKDRFIYDPYEGIVLFDDGWAETIITPPEALELIKNVNKVIEPNENGINGTLDQYIIQTHSRTPFGRIS